MCYFDMFWCTKQHYLLLMLLILCLWTVDVINILSVICWCYLYSVCECWCYWYSLCELLMLLIFCLNCWCYWYSVCELLMLLIFCLNCWCWYSSVNCWCYLYSVCELLMLLIFCLWTVDVIYILSVNCMLLIFCLLTVDVCVSGETSWLSEHITLGYPKKYQGTIRVDSIWCR